MRGRDEARLTRLYLPPPTFSRSEAVLDADASRRLVAVLRLRAGASLRVFDGEGHEREATVVDARRERAILGLGEPVDALPEPPVPVSLVCAFPRGQRGDWLVEKATELGVARLVPLEADRAVLRAGDGRLERWRRIAIEAAEQCGRAVVPEIGKAQVENPGLAAELVADLRATATVRDALLSVRAQAVALYVGPEGGWSEAERVEHREAGRLPVTLGPRTLRAETAAILALAQAIEATGGASTKA